ncbi:hypothetical protein GCM10027047_30550 [Rhodococcus aerolatus]
MHPLVALAQRFAVDWLCRADPLVPPEIMTPGYTIHIGAVDMAGLDDYVAATSGQLARFPGLGITVHELVTDGDGLALRFTEHGGSAAHDGRAAAWTGVTLFRWDGERLAENWTQEDYAGRRRQLAAGVPDVIGPPAPAPWTTQPRPADDGAVDVVRSWLATAAPDASAVVWDDEGAGAEREAVLVPDAVAVARVVASGDRVAFAATQTGTALQTGGRTTLGVAGLVRVEGSRVVAGHVVRDRHGLARRLAG